MSNDLGQSINPELKAQQRWGQSFAAKRPGDTLKQGFRRPIWPVWLRMPPPQRLIGRPLGRRVQRLLIVPLAGMSHIARHSIMDAFPFERLPRPVYMRVRRRPPASGTAIAGRWISPEGLLQSTPFTARRFNVLAADSLCRVLNIRKLETLR